MASFAIIPARGQSKGLANKNIKILNGKPLISYTIEAALSAKNIDEVIVTTEDERISQISSKYNITTLKRPLHLANDMASIIDVVIHVLEKLSVDNRIPDIITLLQPTSPLRGAQDIDNAIELFIKNNCISVISVSELSHSPYLAFDIDNEYLIPLFNKKFFRMRRQELPKTYSPNGAIYVSKPNSIIINNGFYSDRTIPYIMPYERSIDIDTIFDFKLAEVIMKDNYEEFSY